MEVEEEKFARRLDDLLPLLEREINPDNYEDVRRHIRTTFWPQVLKPDLKESILTLSIFQIEEEEDERGADRLLFSFLTLITKLSKHCGLLELHKPQDTLTRIWGKVPTRATSPSLKHTHSAHAHSLSCFTRRSH